MQKDSSAPVLLYSSLIFCHLIDLILDLMNGVRDVEDVWCFDERL